MHGTQKIGQPTGVDNRYSLVFNIYTAFSFDKNTINFLKSLIAKGWVTYVQYMGWEKHKFSKLNILWILS